MHFVSAHDASCLRTIDGLSHMCLSRANDFFATNRLLELLQNLNSQSQVECMFSFPSLAMPKIHVLKHVHHSVPSFCTLSYTVLYSIYSYKD